MFIWLLILCLTVIYSGIGFLLALRQKTTGKIFGNSNTEGGYVEPAIYDADYYRDLSPT